MQQNSQLSESSLSINQSINQLINQSTKTHLYSAICWETNQRRNNCFHYVPKKISRKTNKAF